MCKAKLFIIGNALFLIGSLFSLQQVFAQEGRKFISSTLIQADHYIIRMEPLKIQPRNDDDLNYLINHVLKVNGYYRGSATVDFAIVETVDEVYMYTLSMMYEEKTGYKVDYERSKMHNLSGSAKGKVIAIFHKEAKQE